MINHHTLISNKLIIKKDPIYKLIAIKEKEELDSREHKAYLLLQITPHSEILNVYHSHKSNQKLLSNKI
jgi:hypothetical protein